MQLLIKLKSGDNVVVCVEERIARLSGLLAAILADNDDGIPVEPITLTEITGQVLQLIFHQWCRHHQNDPECLQNEYLPNLDNLRNLPEWDEQFLNELDALSLAELISAAEHLKIPKLLHLARRMHRLRSSRSNNPLANNNNNAMELDEDGEDAEGNRNFPYLHSQAIIEIGQMLR